MSTVESWFGSAAVAEALPKPSPRRHPAAPARAKRTQSRSFRVRWSLIWMIVFAVLLVGVVAVNVAVLRAHVSVTDLDAKIARLQQGNASLTSQYWSMTAPSQLEAAARDAHLVPATEADTTLIDMAGRK